MDINALLVFLDIVRAGSLAEAARRTGVPKSTISRKLQELENELGVRLLQRTTRQLGLTDAGRRLLVHARELAAVVERARTDLRAKGGEAPRGPLRVTASVSLGERILAPVLVEFVEQHPHVELDLVLDPARTDLIDAEIDVAIRIGEPDPKSPLIARRLGEAALYPCASPAYLEQHGRPEGLAELREHQAIFYRPSRDLPTFVLEGPGGEVHRVTPRARLHVNSHVLARDAARAGIGIALLPAPFCRVDLARGRLERAPTGCRTPLKWVYAAFPNRELPAVARAFVDFIAERMDSSAFVLE